ncbi:MAG: serine protease [Desulfobacterales bacterium]|nr:serine protease [Desulfobacterales bacterium]
MLMNLKHGIIIFLFILIGIFRSVILQGEENNSTLNNVYVIPVNGTVEPGMAAFIKRSLEDTVSNNAALVILEMDTFGGRVDSALEIVDHITNIPKAKTIAYISKNALSAGALISLACNEIYMKHHTTVGDCAPITYSNEGPQMLGEKFQSPLRAKFRALAKKNGYQEVLAESMVTPEMVVYKVILDDNRVLYVDENEYEELEKNEKDKIKSKKTIVAKGELLTMDDKEALDLGFSKGSVQNIDEIISKTEIENHKIINVSESWSEEMVRLIITISPILMMIGLAALYIELKAPGFGVPGIIGIICLGLVFFSQYLVGLADHTELLIILLGLVFLGFEIFVTPGFGVMGFSGILIIGIGFILAFQGFVIPDPSLPWEKDILMNNAIKVLGSYFIAFILSLTFIKYFLPKLGTIVEGPYLATTLDNAHADSLETETINVGDFGVAFSFLRPSGKVKIGNDVIDAITEGDFIEKGTPVYVYQIKGNKIIVARK